MINLYIICIFIITKAYLQLPSRYTFPFEPNEYGNFIITICISKKTNCFPFKLSLTVKQVLILDGANYKGGYKPSESDTFKHVAVSLGKPFNDDYIYGRYGRDTLYINNTDIIIENLQFIIIEEGITQHNKNFFGVIGIGHIYEYIDKDSGFFEKLLLNENFVPNERTLSLTKTQMLIGTDINSIIALSQNKIIRKCKIVDDSSFDGLLSCGVDKSFIYDLDYRITEQALSGHKVRFSIEQNDFYVPVDMFNFVKNIILSEKGRGECYEDIRKRGKHLIKCNFRKSDHSAKNYMRFDLFRRKLYLVIGNWNIQFTLGELFNWDEEYLMLMFYERNKDWVLGRKFLDKYMLTFDRNENFIYLTNITTT